VALSSADNAASEPGADAASFTLTRSGTTTAPLLVNYSLGGTAVNGTDYSSLSNFALIPAGLASTIVPVTPLNDTLAEGTENVSITIGETSHYNAGAPTNVVLSIADDEAAPPALSVGLGLAGSGMYALSAVGAASRVVDIESSSDLVTWQRFTSMINASGTNHVFEPIGAGAVFFRANQQ